jgi:predicted alpha/beta hydrolase
MADQKTKKLSFESRDGFILQGELHSPSQERQDGPVVVLSPGMGVPARFYRPFSRFLVNQGMRVLLFDFRGIGWSAVDDLKTLRANATTWGSMDLAAAIDLARKISDGHQLVGIGHSFGGSIFGFTDNITCLHKLVHLGSQSGFYGLFGWKTRLYMLFNIHLAMPLLTRLLGYYPAHWLSGSEPLPADFIAEWSDWCQRRDYFMDKRFSVRERGHHREYQGPLLSLSFADDDFATRESVDRMAAYYAGSQVERRHIQPSEVSAASLGHFDLFKRSNGSGVWQIVADWINSPTNRL